MAKPQVLATYTVHIENGVVTGVGVPQSVLDYIQAELDWEKANPGVTPTASGDYEVTLWDTGNKSMIRADAVGKAGIIWPDLPEDTPTATTIDEWLELAKGMGVNALPAPAQPTEPAIAQAESVWRQEAVWSPEVKSVHPKDIMPGFENWLKEGTGTTPKELAKTNPDLFRTLYAEYRSRVIPQSGHRTGRSTRRAPRTSRTPNRTLGGVRR